MAYLLGSCTDLTSYRSFKIRISLSIRNEESNYIVTNRMNVFDDTNIDIWDGGRRCTLGLLSYAGFPSSWKHGVWYVLELFHVITCKIAHHHAENVDDGEPGTLALLMSEMGASASIVSPVAGQVQIGTKKS